MKKQLEKFYYSFGDRGVMFILFACSVVMHALLAVIPEYPAIQPDEIGTASVAAFYSGRDWSGLMQSIGYYYGYIQAIFYAPLFSIFGGNPAALYKAMLVVNGILISFIPLLAYHLSSKLGVGKVWQKIVIALCSGLYITYVAHSKFIWNEAVCGLLPWLLIWCVFMAWDRKNSHSRFAMSMLSGFMCAVCYAAHSRLLAVAAALVVTLLVMRIWLKEKILNLPVFFITMGLSFVTEHFCAAAIKNAVWNGRASGNVTENELGRLSGLLESGGIGRFFSTLFGHIYTFMTSTVGLGAIALTVISVMIGSRIAENAREKRRAEVDEDGTKEYEPTEHRYSTRLMLFGLYAFFAVGGTMLMSALFKFNSTSINSAKDLVIFGRYTDSVAPLAIMLALIFLFMYGYKLRHIFSAAAVYAYVCFAFAVSAYPIVRDAPGYRESPILALMPWRIGEELSEPLTGMSFVIMSSCVFGLFALMVVFCSCSNRHYVQIVSVLLCGVFVYTTVYAGAEYLPMRAEDNEKHILPAREISQIIYNDPQSPPIAAYGLSSRMSSLVQFMNPDASVSITRKMKDIPDNCLLITTLNEEITLTTGAEIIGTTSNYIVYAVGDSARDYIRYKRSSDSVPAGETKTEG